MNMRPLIKIPGFILGRHSLNGKGYTQILSRKKKSPEKEPEEVIYNWVDYIPPLFHLSGSSGSKPSL